ncbi:MAG: hypothetical protein BWY84_00143 [Candidatus Aerophobetes bacterium ADurb.Bin490]|nr:MAG: hypothetical protein BWY84_00143 [Candidatus Aerophobetes bacterium ADurb.Bin490]
MKITHITAQNYLGASAVERDDRTGELFGEVETICALAEMPDGAVISGALLMAARKEWR